MCLQNLMNFHHCLFKILKKNQNVTDGRMDGWKDGQMDRKTDRQTDGRTTWKQYTQFAEGQGYKYQIQFILWQNAVFGFWIISLNHIRFVQHYFKHHVSNKGILATSMDPHQMPQKVVPDHSLHCTVCIWSKKNDPEISVKIIKKMESSNLLQ